MRRTESEDAGLVAGLACWVTAAIFLTGLLILAVKLREVQITDSAKYDYANERQSIRRVQTGGERGRILDRNGIALADNRKSVSIVCHPAAFQERTWDATVKRILDAIENVSHTIGRPSPLKESVVRRHVNQTLAMPLRVWLDVSERELAVFCEHEREFEGFDIEEAVERVYPRRSLAAHVLGYVGRDRGEAQAGDEKFNFYLTELRGRAGLERYYDSFLCGVSGEKKVLVDARGFAIREWTVVEPRKGPDLCLTIDSRIQAAAEGELAGCRGACVVLDPRTGDVLALASAPTYDLNDFVPMLFAEDYSRLTANPDKPLINRACDGRYAPGSTFKPITALAGLSVGCSPNDTYECTGCFDLGSLHLRCASRWGHGPLDMRHALMKSCNPYFCNLAMTIGTNAIIRTARAFGLGEETGIDFESDKPGNVPDGEWKLRARRERWFPGDLAQMSIGQGQLVVTPLQMARVAGALATGYLVTPHLKKDLLIDRRQLPISRRHLQIVREGMYLVVNGDKDDRGTGWRAGDNVNTKVCGKTGTAEIGNGANRRKNTWFIAYAPADAPTIALALVIENGESGGGTSAPKVGAILRTIFGEKEKQS